MRPARLVDASLPCAELDRVFVTEPDTTSVLVLDRSTPSQPGLVDKALVDGSWAVQECGIMRLVPATCRRRTHRGGRRA